MHARRAIGVGHVRVGARAVHDDAVGGRRAHALEHGMDIFGHIAAQHALVEGRRVDVQLRLGHPLPEVASPQLEQPIEIHQRMGRDDGARRMRRGHRLGLEVVAAHPGRDDHGALGERFGAGRAMRLAGEDERNVGMAREDLAVRLGGQMARRVGEPQDAPLGGDRSIEQRRLAVGDQHVACGRMRPVPGQPLNVLGGHREAAAVERAHVVAGARERARQAGEVLLDAAKRLARRRVAVEGHRIVDQQDIHGATVIRRDLSTCQAARSALPKRPDGARLATMENIMTERRP